MHTTTSIYLDALRLTAAIGVVAAHVSSPRFSRGMPDLNFVGHGAVSIFLVLSGFVIAFVASGRENTPRVFLRARAARIYSVVLPAIVVTVLADGVSRLADPASYHAVAYAHRSLPLAILADLFFLDQSWGFDDRLLSNGPIWSLG